MNRILCAFLALGFVQLAMVVNSNEPELSRRCLDSHGSFGLIEICTDAIVSRSLIILCSESSPCRTRLDQIVINCNSTAVDRASASYAYELLELCKPCEQARDALESRNDCVYAISGTNASTAICTGTCRTLYDNFINNCQDYMPVAHDYSTAIETFCPDPCDAAQAALNANTTCANAVTYSNRRLTCSGTCRSLSEDVINACADVEDSSVPITRERLNQICESPSSPSPSSSPPSSSVSVLQASGIITLLLVALCNSALTF